MNPTLQAWRIASPPPIAWMMASFRDSLVEPRVPRGSGRACVAAAPNPGKVQFPSGDGFVINLQETPEMLDATTRLAVQINSEAGSL